jgi:hypothetical protein
MCSRRLRQLDVHAREIRAVVVRAALVRAAAAAVQDADQVHHRVAPVRKARELRRLVHVGFQHLHGGKQDQRLAALAPARGHGDAGAARRERCNEVAADEAGAAENEDVLGLHAGPPEARIIAYYGSSSLTRSPAAFAGTVPIRSLSGSTGPPSSCE